MLKERPLPPPPAAAPAVAPPAPLRRRSWSWLVGAGVHAWPELLLLLGLCAVIFFFRLGEPSLWDNSEPEYAATALEMLQRGDWLTPHFNGHPVFVHPPLYYWLTAGAFALLGVSEFSARLFSALFAVGGVLLVFQIGRMLYNGRVGLYAAYALATSLGYVAVARLAFLDTALNFFGLLAVYAFLRAHAAPSWARWAGFWAALGLAVLAKGPVGLVTPWLALLPFLFLIRRQAVLLDRRFWLAAPAFLAVAGPWYAGEIGTHGTAFVLTYFAEFTVGRFVGVVMNQSGPWYYYFVTLVPMLFPWCAWLPGAVYHLYRRRRETSSLFVLLWIAVPLAFFSTAQTKMPWYIITVYPFLAIALGKFFHDWNLEGEEDPVLRWHGWAGLAALVALSLGSLLWLPGAVIAMGYPEAIRLAPLALLALAGALLAAAGARKSPSVAFTCCAGTALMLVVFLAAAVVPQAERYKRRGLAAQLAALAAPADRVGICDSFGFTVPFYGRHRVDLIAQDTGTIRGFLADPRQRNFYLMPLLTYREVRASGAPLRLLGMDDAFALVVGGRR